MTREQADHIFLATCRGLPSPYRELCEVVLGDKDFQEGFGARSHHHNFKGGLYIHTAEVLQNCASLTQPLDRNVLYTAAVWHDYLKVRDYIVDTEGNIQYTRYKSQIYHIAGSFAAFQQKAKEFGLGQDPTDHICHCILAHHGRPEWGSAITPQTPEALTLHWADCMSAWFENGTYKEKK